MWNFSGARQHEGHFSVALFGMLLLGSIAAVRFREDEPEQPLRSQNSSIHALRPRGDPDYYTFRARAWVTGWVTTDTFDSVDVGFEYVDHEIIRIADGFVAWVLWYIADLNVVKNIIWYVVRRQGGRIKTELNKLKRMAKERVAALLDDRELLGWYSFFMPYFGNKTELLEALVPNASMVVYSQNGSVVPVIEIPSAKAEAISRACTRPDDPAYLFYKLVPWIGMAGLLTYLARPRSGFGLLFTGVALNTVFAGVVCNTVVPWYIGDYDSNTTVEVPDQIRSLGFLDNITLDHRFIGDTLRVQVEPLSEELLAEVVKNIAIQVGNKPLDIPVRIADGHAVIHVEKNRSAIVEGTWFDVDIEIEDCAPFCEGRCYIFKCKI